MRIAAAFLLLGVALAGQTAVAPQQPKPDPLSSYLASLQSQSPAAAKPATAQAQPSIEALPYQSQVDYLSGFLPKGKHNVLIDAALIFNGLAEHNEGTLCTGDMSGSASSYADNQVSFGASTDSLCREVSNKRGIVVLGMRDADWPRTAHLIFMGCKEGYSKGQKALDLATLGYLTPLTPNDKCFVQEGPEQRVELSREKHGNWKIYVGARAVLGGKVHLAQFSVLEVRLASLRRGRALMPGLKQRACTASPLFIGVPKTSFGCRRCRRCRRGQRVGDRP